MARRLPPRKGPKSSGPRGPFRATSSSRPPSRAGKPKRAAGPKAAGPKAAGPKRAPGARSRAESKGTGAAGPERLHKFLARAGVGSRRSCEELILQGRVSVDGEVVREVGTKVDPASQKVELDGQRVKPERSVYFAVHKPKGVVSTNNDPAGRPRVVDLLAEVPERVYTVGRLDEDSTGLMILTNDGELANRLAHPKFGVEKVYRALVAGNPEREALDKLVEGIWLAEGKVRAKRVRAVGHRGDATMLEIVLAEGKNREVRRMLAKLGHKVMNLQRVAVGPISVKGLKPGHWRHLSPRELDLLRRVANGEPVPTATFGQREEFRDRRPETPRRGAGRQDRPAGPPRPAAPPPRPAGPPGRVRLADHSDEGPMMLPPPRGRRPAGGPGAGPKRRPDTSAPGPKRRPEVAGPGPKRRSEGAGPGPKRRYGDAGPAHGPGPGPKRYGQAGPPPRGGPRRRLDLEIEVGPEVEAGPPPRFGGAGGPGPRRPAPGRPGGPPPQRRSPGGPAGRGPGGGPGGRGPAGGPQGRRPGGPPPVGGPPSRRIIGLGSGMPDLGGGPPPRPGAKRPPRPDSAPKPRPRPLRKPRRERPGGEGAPGGDES